MACLVSYAPSLRSNSKHDHEEHPLHSSSQPSYLEVKPRSIQIPETGMDTTTSLRPLLKAEARPAAIQRVVASIVGVVETNLVLMAARQIATQGMYLQSRYSYRGLCTMGKKKILIVEDDPDVLHSMHVRLRAHDYDTSSAEDAISCMAEARKSEPDLIILDLGLPAGDGFLLMDRFKKVPSLASVPVIVVSGRDIRENQKKIVQSGAKAFLQKPVDNAMLLAVIRKALGEQTSKEEPVVYNLGNVF
jgi:CheY-like chemotaxis protein